jgi:hypothetical protein
VAGWLLVEVLEGLIAAQYRRDLKNRRLGPGFLIQSLLGAWSSWSAPRYPMNGPRPHGRTGTRGTQRQEKGRILLLIGFPRTRVNKGERKAEASKGDPRHIMERYFA